MKKIGILAPHKLDEKLGNVHKLNFWCSEFVENTGVALPFIIPTNIKNIDYYVDFFDGFIIPGWNDIDPTLYWEIHSWSIETIKEHDDFLLSFLEKAVASQKPILWICKWLQIINVYFGWTLHQDIPNHMNFTQKECWVHHVEIESHSFLHNIFQTNILEVNSIHHQCIKTLGNDLVIEWKSQEDEIIEAIKHKTKPIFALQWHPEFMLEHQKIFDRFIKNIK